MAKFKLFSSSSFRKRERLPTPLLIQNEP